VPAEGGLRLVCSPWTAVSASAERQRDRGASVGLKRHGVSTGPEHSLDDPLGIDRPVDPCTEV